MDDKFSKDNSKKCDSQAAHGGDFDLETLPPDNACGEFVIEGDRLKKYVGASPRAVIPSGVTSIEECAFDGCEQLESVVIPSTVKHIGRWAFFGCKSLKEVDIPSVEDIDWCAFEDCTSLKRVNIANGSTLISERVFAGCLGLEELHIPASVRAICVSAFENCISLKRVTLPLALKDDAPELFSNVLDEYPLPNIEFEFI